MALGVVPEKTLGRIRSDAVCQFPLGECERLSATGAVEGVDGTRLPKSGVTLFAMDGVTDSGLSIGTAKSRQRGRCRRQEGGGPAGSGAWAGRRAKGGEGGGSPIVWFGPQAQVVLTLRDV